MTEKSAFGSERLTYVLLNRKWGWRKTSPSTTYNYPELGRVTDMKAIFISDGPDGYRHYRALSAVYKVTRQFTTVIYRSFTGLEVDHYTSRADDISSSCVR